MLKKLTQFYYPKNIEEACKYLANSEYRTTVIAGGTSEALRRDNSYEALVSLAGVKELNHIKKEGSFFRIGAATPVQDIYKSKLLKGPAGDLLKEAAGKIGSTLLRNSISAGGNLVALFPWSDLPPCYMVLDAEVVCRKGKPKRTVPVQTLIDEKPGTFLQKEEIIAEIVIPEYGKGTGTAFSKMAKTANDYATITVAARIAIKSGKIEQARLAVNAITPAPIRLLEAETELTGQKVTPELLAKVANSAAAAVKVRKDFRASVEYRREVLEVMIRRCLTEACQKAGK